MADALKERSRQLDQPFKQVMNDTLRRGLSPGAAEEHPTYRVRPHDSGFRPGVDPLRLNQMNDALQADELARRDTE